MIPQFTMAMYGTKELLLEAKCAWLEEQIEWLEENHFSFGTDIYRGTWWLTVHGEDGEEERCYVGESLLDCIDQAQPNEEK